ncbi:MAG TPA: helix-turn-helix transcriptional regulator [Candidatus Portnoybacteria bacterium]|jgi:ribosome-binding protein aMBF1 (putative translation factor)|nr:helix-turn-helix transcriptional regulator [Candidatus Portnoybacteria bacterium]MDD5752338.1 helix-turn-helix transcriptional regulator [Candidatus Portnoybacteria bacterium]HOZ16477.1 helix-turn-helix transcriptional regulator [Candidatus Portnoybacteria bacterium]HPH52091.1 helix-turn-helix transcriptional regulator [Candidatus Portnoybacteria bacterium]HPJ80296.1 helix-turn-helix transcriptional regulator [Candidatus Portnoybacteria bacterium]
MNKKIKARDFQKYLAQQLKNPQFKKHYDEYGKQLEIAYQILQLRKQKKMSQLQLAKKLKTKQSNIARIEAGKQNLSIQTLDNIARALNSDLIINLS